MFDRLTAWWQQLGPRHSKFQRHIFELLLLPGIFHMLWELSSKRFEGPGGFLWRDFWRSQLKVLALWVIIATVGSILYYLFSRRLNLDLHFYYRAWLCRIKPRKWLKPREKDIIESFVSFKPRDKDWKHRRPCFVEREDLTRKSFWPGWVFSIITLFGNKKPCVWQEVIADPENGTRWKLHVDLTGESYGIYSNDGKNFLKERFLTQNVGASEEVQNRSKVIHESMQPNALTAKGWTWNDSGCQLPIRWASGGILPLVWYKKSFWVLLFFRDVSPIGLNVPNGASETRDEYKNIRRLLAREFCEEVVVLSGLPVKKADLVQRDFNAEHHDLAPFMNEPFAEEHARLRQEHDGFTIQRTSSQKRELHFLSTPFAVHVDFHGPNLEDIVPEDFNNVVYSVNPAEFGIEVMALARFNLGDREYIIDGEYDLSRKVLIRRPPVLLKLSFLSEVYERNKSLGALCGPGPCVDGKLMSEVALEHCVVFDADVALRKSRRKKIQEYMAEHHQGGSLRGDLLWEREKIIDAWLAKYESAVSLTKTEGLRGDEPANKELRTLCPVTWKTLELAFAHRLFEEIFAEEHRLHNRFK